MQRPPFRFLIAGLLIGIAGQLGPAVAQDRDDTLILQARDAYQKKDKARLAQFKTVALDTHHPLAAWVDYWELTSRLHDATAADVAAFYARWPGSYVEDRLRNDWLLELGRRRDWAGVAQEYPRFRMDDDREVTCYAMMAEQQAGHAVKDAALNAWMNQLQTDDGCQLLARTLLDAKILSPEDVWRKLRYAVERNRLPLARATANLLGDDISKPVAELLDNPARYLTRKANAKGTAGSALAALAIGRLATNDAELAAKQMADRWSKALEADDAAWAWAIVAKQGALGLLPDATDWSDKAWSRLKKREASPPDWSDETLNWHARAWLRLGQGDERWRRVLRCIEAMSTSERNEAVWQYWRARAELALAPAGAAGDAQRSDAKQHLAALASQLGYYGQLAAEDLGAPQPLPPTPAPLTLGELSPILTHPGFQRALFAMALGLRSEGVREWNFSLIGLNDRQLLAAAQLACDRQIWDRCINSSDRTRAQFNMAQRFPMPLRDALVARATEVGLDPAYAYGLIRQESRFITDARSSVGASGLMQVMPATARWTAKKIGMGNFRPDMLNDQDVNLKIGTSYLKLVMDDFDGSQAMAAAAYNAGPSRPRRWRNGPALEPAVWVENIPFNETRDYVKKVLSNATYYAAILSGKPASLKARMGDSIGPRTQPASALDNELP